jgi:hypothetical protein
MVRWIIAGLVLIVAGIAMAGIGFSGSMEDKAVQQRGTKTIAAVVDKKEEVDRDSDGDEQETYWLHLKFFDLKQAEHNTRRSVDKDVFDKTDIGATVDIKYLEDNPEIVRLKAETEQDPMILAYVLGAMGGVTASLGIGVIIMGVKAKGQRPPDSAPNH